MGRTRIQTQVVWIQNLFVFPVSNTVSCTWEFNTCVMNWIESSSWVTVLHPNSTEYFPWAADKCKIDWFEIYLFYSPAYAADFLINSEMLHCWQDILSKD